MIDIGRFRKLPMPVQSPDEWLYFIEFIQTYFRNRGIEAPIIVEIGIQSNLQKRFYEQYLGIDGEHIGIDVSDKYSKPDIFGDALDPAILSVLKVKLAGRKINLLFLDASQRYEDVMVYFELYEPLVSDIIVMHPILTTTNHPDGTRRVWESIWHNQRDKWNFITIYSQVGADHPCARYQFGTGLLIRKDPL